MEPNALQIVLSYLSDIKLDFTTVIGGLVLINLIMFAWGKISMIFEETYYGLGDRLADKRMPGVSELNQLRRNAVRYRGSAEGDVWNTRYKRKLREYSLNLDDDRDSIH